MKNTKIFRILSIAVVLSLLVMALPISPVLAASEEIMLDPEAGEIGDEIEVIGEDFEESYYNSSTDYYYFYVTVYFSHEDADEGDEIDDEVENYEVVDSGVYVDDDGEFETDFDVPDELTDGEDDEDVGGGTYYVYVTYSGDDEIVAVAEFTVLFAEIKLYPDEGPVGTEVSIAGVDFADYEDITVDFDDEEVDIESGDAATDS